MTHTWTTNVLQKLLISIWIWGASIGLLGNAAKSLGRWVPPRHDYICKTMFSILCMFLQGVWSQEQGTVNKKHVLKGFTVVRLIKFQSLWGELNAIRVLAEMEKLEKDTDHGANKDRSRVRGTWRNRCKSIHLEKLLNFKVPHKKRCATPLWCQTAGDLILMLKKYELYVSWSIQRESPFYGKLGDCTNPEHVPKRDSSMAFKTSSLRPHGNWLSHSEFVIHSMHWHVALQPGLWILRYPSVSRHSLKLYHPWMSNRLFCTCLLHGILGIPINSVGIKHQRYCFCFENDF